MKDSEIKIKLSYIKGLKSVVLDELKKNDLRVVGEGDDFVYVEFLEEYIPIIKNLKSATRAYLIYENQKYNPGYISNHKSVLGSLIDVIIGLDKFKTFKISCAGAESVEVRSIAKFVEDTYGLNEKDEADLKISIIKIEEVWELGVQITTRPLSVRDYKTINMSGAMDSTIAYAVNSFCKLESAKSYLNIFSGSGTLLIEAALAYPDLEKLVGFDNDKKHLSSSIQNIKKAGLMERIKVSEFDILDSPDFGSFDAIVSDVPFGMSISKDEDLEKLYSSFVDYCEKSLNPLGVLVIYTSQYELIESILINSKFKIVQSLQLKFITSVDAYLRPKIIVCEFKNK